jgi:hypothetical protein
MSLLLTQNSKRKTQHFILGFLLVFCLFSSTCFAQGVLANPLWRLPSLPNLPSGERIYDAGGASPDEAKGLDPTSRPIDTQEEDLKPGADGVAKANKYKIGYSGNTKGIQGKIEKNRGTEQEDSEAGELSGQTLRQPDAPSLGFQYQPSLFGQIGFDAGVGKASKQTKD